jgi:hypothetical protein
MTVAGGWSAKAKVFYDMARKVHGGMGPIKDLLVTDPYIYVDKSEKIRSAELITFYDTSTVSIFRKPGSRSISRLTPEVGGRHQELSGDGPSNSTERSKDLASASCSFEQ